MNVGFITKPNQKGQIVIPKEYRDKLNIGAHSTLNIVLRGQVIQLYPVNKVIADVEREDSYVEILKKTQGAWADENWDTLTAKRRQLELKAARQRKKAW